MNNSAHRIFAISFGQALVRGLYLTGNKIYHASLGTTPGDLTVALAAITKEVEKLAGEKVTPDQVVLTGRQSDLDELQGKVEASFLTEEKAVAAAEQFLTKSFGQPTAILDLGPSAFLDRYPAEEIGRWLPFVTNLTDIENHLANKRLFPRVLPINTHEYEIDLAVARQAIIKLGAREGKEYLPIETKINLVLTGGLLSGAATVSDVAGVVLDSFYFKSGATIAIDPTGILVPLGAVLAEVQRTEVSPPSLRQIGSALHLGGTHRAVIDFGYETKQRLALEPGEIVTIPAEEGREITVTVGGPKTSHDYVLTGGEGGIYLDNRTRPLGVVASSRDSISKILSWRKSLSADKLVEEAAA